VIDPLLGFVNEIVTVADAPAARAPDETVIYGLRLNVPV
jgi:hypothetical protein